MGDALDLRIRRTACCTNRLDRRDDPYAHNNETANRYAEEVSLIFSSGDPALENIFSEACRPSRRELLPTIAALAESQQR